VVQVLLEQQIAAVVAEAEQVTVDTLVLLLLVVQE
jgi:hypothetical protein